MSTTVTRIISIGLLFVAIGLAAFLINSIKYDIELEEKTKQGEAVIIEKLKFIREAEKVYLEVHGQFTSDWDKLISFIDTADYYVTQRTEEIITLAYGADSIVVHIDTIDVIPAKDRIFKKTNYITAADNGTFLGYNAIVGQSIIIGSKVYYYSSENDDRRKTYISAMQGTVTQLAKMNPGDRISKGENLVTLLEYKFDPNMDISNMAYIPGSDKKFDIFADKINKSGVMIDVVEVKNTIPVNPARNEDNEQRNRKPLRFGSRTDVTTSGNWE